VAQYLDRGPIVLPLIVDPSEWPPDSTQRPPAVRDFTGAAATLKWQDWPAFNCVI
jgi:hypothetical protein